ncbi:efflux RND transporter periplasmic adaptor subunit [Alkalibacillus haloalkaliphilus]|uniref:efflux RND transporter periplasmic adaptor subunit n=1 Tax=Alkalibacillus haloalkaliphilus TaxID=94136 RepID=UPI00031C356B|nr:HlyD family efflux transporter periplasmic adaptor subunit [Alkalibacillus haloalkaliphilus]
MKKWMLILAVLSVFILSACNEETDEEEVETVTPVEVEEVTVEDFSVTKSFTARSMPNDQVPVLAEAPGEVEELFVERGDEVEEGDVIAEYSSQYGWMEIETPIDGIIQELNLQEDRMVTTEEPAAVVVNTDPLVLHFQLTANNRDLIEVGDDVRYKVSQADRDGEAEVTYIASTAGESGLFDVESEVEQTDAPVPSGLTAQVKIDEVIESDAYVVPTEAIVERGADQFVYIVENDEAIRVDVDVIAMQSQYTAIEPLADDIIAEGDTVVTRGQLTIEDGQTVRIVEED